MIAYGTQWLDQRRFLKYVASKSVFKQGSVEGVEALSSRLAVRQSGQEEDDVHVIPSAEDVLNGYVPLSK